MLAIPKAPGVRPASRPAEDERASWPAALELELGRRAGKTRLRHARHHGPLRVQRPFHPEPDGAAHVVVLHPPAGLVGGDRLTVRARVDDGARALLTTTGAGKVYRTAGARAAMETELAVGEGADLEHVPQEAVVFEGADARLTTRVALAAGARFCGWEVVCLGRPACGEGFARGALHLAFEIGREGHPLFVERGRVEGGAPMLDAAWGLWGRPAFGTMVATEGEPTAVREALAAAHPEARAAVTRVSGLTVVRALGRDGTHVRSILEVARHVVRDAWSRPRVDPAIWRS
ncbi:MAG TPA: urease accessory protein UreD [Sandaracinaceae bacterium LLY-WYZ-13_1]|nr:urease accessory protein UreD [Sandaracinaceae bacterium LLY-WYZ-13_1]